MRALALLLAAGCAGGGAGGLTPFWSSAEAPELDKPFQNFDALWRGGDAVYSVPLAPDRTLWLFGDSLVSAPGQPGRRDVQVVRNTIAIQSGFNPPQFFWRTVEGKPGPAFPSDAPNRWLWPLGGARDGPALHLFFTEIEAETKGPGFFAAANLLLTISNPDEPPGQWLTRKSFVPASRMTASGDRAFGSSVLRHQGRFYVYGTREDRAKGRGGTTLLVARSERLDDFARWQFLGPDGRWTGDVEKAADLFAEAAPEVSVTWFPATREFIAVYTRFGLAAEILVRRAPSPEGPWGPPAILFRSPEMTWSPGYYTSGAKAHPQLSSAPHELVVSYVAGSMSPRDRLTDLRLFWPRFVRASLH